jgi:hypothetical protein
MTFRPTSTIPLLAAAALAGCYTPMPAPAAAPHAATATITLTAAGAVPATAVQVPGFAVVVFHNATDAPLTVAIDRPLGICVHCDTALGFSEHDHRARADAIPPAGTVSLCFHDAGAFAWEATGRERTWRGTVHVGAGR